MGEPALKERVSSLEMAMMDLTCESMKTDMAVKQLSTEMKDFKDEMKDFKNEMLNFKDEIKDFKNEIKDSKDVRKDLKDDPLDFNDDTGSFKANAEADRKSMNKKWCELVNKMGTIVEDIVAPSLEGIVKEYFEVNEFDLFAEQCRKKSIDGKSIREFDVIAESEKYFFVVETKAIPQTEYVADFIKLVPDLKIWFPDVKNKQFIPIFSSFYLPENIVKYLTKNNIFAMAMKDDNMDILNYKNIRSSNPV